MDPVVVGSNPIIHPNTPSRDALTQMRVSLETNGLVCKATVAVPSESFEEQVAERLKSAAGDLKLPGFRPGKVPLTEVRRRFGDQLRREVASELMQSSFAEAVRQEQLALAGNPSVELLNIDAGRDLEYIATFEVLPSFDLTPLDQLRIRRPQAEIEESDIDATVQSLRTQQTEWHPVERAAKAGDRVTVDYAIAVDGKTVAEKEGAKLTLDETPGPSELINALPGMSAAETRAFPVAWGLPSEDDLDDADDDDHAGDDDHEASSDNEALASDQPSDSEAAPTPAVDDPLTAETGDTDAAQLSAEDATELATAEADSDDLPVDAPADPDDDPDDPLLRQGIGEVTVHVVEEPHLPDVDDAFFDWFGIEQGDDRLAKFRAGVRERMQLELKAATRRVLAAEVSRVLVDAHDFELPETMVETELQNKWARWLRTPVPARDNPFRHVAEREVRSRLVLSEIVSQQAMTPDDERVRARIDEIAASYEESDEIRRSIYGNEEQLDQIANAVLEEQVVDYVLEHAQVVTVPLAYREVTAGDPFLDLDVEDDTDEDDDPSEVDDAASAVTDAAADAAANAAADAVVEPVAENSSDATQSPAEATAETGEGPPPEGIGNKVRRWFGRKSA